MSSGRAFRFRCSACGHSQSVLPGALPSAGEERAVEPHTMDEPEDAPAPRRAVEAAPAPAAGPPAPEPSPIAADEGVFLKQNGQIYMVRDWDTLKRWIQERRVDRHDLVSEGGVRWEPVGSRADLMLAFSSGLPDLPTTEPTPFPFGSTETPFGTGSSPSMGWHDDDTEGVPTGLPPLPTEEVHERSPSVAPPALLDDDDETPSPAPRAPSTASPPSSMSPPPTPTIAPPALDDEDSDDSDPERSAEAVATAPGSVMRLKDPPKLPTPVPMAPAPTPPGPTQVSTSASGAWDDLMVTEPTVTPRVDTPAREIQQVDFADEWSAAQASASPSRSNLMYIGAAVAAFALAAAILGYVFSGDPAAPGPRPPALPAPVAASAPVEPAPVVPAAVEPAGVEPAPVEPAPVEPTPVVAPTPAPVAAPTPAPVAPAPVVPAPVAAAPKPAPKPAEPAPPKPAAPAPPKPADPPKLATRPALDAAWNLADSDPAAAAKQFRAVLDASPSNAEAHYGYGYTMLKRSNIDEAKKHLCLARRNNPAPDILQDVNGLLASRQLGCD
jgi:hypothetical protein